MRYLDDDEPRHRKAERPRRQRRRLTRAEIRAANERSLAEQLERDRRDAQRHAERLQRGRDAAEAYVQPSDAAYRPRNVDPLLRGAARATGETAKAVKREKATLRTDHPDGAA